MCLSNIASQRRPAFPSAVAATQPAPEFIANPFGTDSATFDAGNAANFKQVAPTPAPTPAPKPKPAPPRAPIRPVRGGNYGNRYFME